MDGEREQRRINKQGETSDHGFVDRISALPDFQILHILSFLPMKDVFRTSVLAKRWQYLWTCVDTFTFICNDKYPGQKFITFVNNTLIQNTCTRVRKFSISCEVSGVIGNLYPWIRFATGKKVEELELNLESSASRGIFYRLPIHLYSNLSLQKLKMRNCAIESSHIISWNSLTTLVMENMGVDQIAMENVLSGCPALQEIKLRDLCGDRLNFKIISKSLRKIILDWTPTDADFDIDFAHIGAPNLQEFHISGIDAWKVGQLHGLQSSVHVYLNFTFSVDCSNPEIQYLVAFLVSVQHVEKFTLGPQCVKALAVAQLKGFKSRELQCTHLTLDSYISMSELPGILWLLQRATHLETLIINMSGHPSKDLINYTSLFQRHRGETYLSNQKNMKFLTGLKTVKIVEFGGHRNSCEKFFEMELVEFILKYGKSLENINCDSGRVTRLSKSPRSSPNAKIIFS